MSSEPIKVCLVGCGWIGEEHAKIYKDLQEQGRVEFFVCDVDREKVKIFKEKYNAKGIFLDYYDVLGSSIEVVDICLPHNQHAEATILAANVGKHILLEKPLATSIEEADRIFEGIKDKKIKFMLAENWRFIPTIRVAKEFLDKREIGEPLLIQGNSIQYFVPSGWRRSKSDMGGGVLIDRGIHLIDMLYNLGGEIRSVYALATHKSILEIEGEDTVVLLMNFTTGTIGNITVTWGIKKPLKQSLFVIYGTEGTIWEDSGKVFLLKNNTCEKLYEAMTDNSIREEIFHFIDCITEDKEPLVSFNIARKDLEIATAAYISIQSNETVFLPLKEKKYHVGEEADWI
ncbi:MAG: Gfo/Idh/MocA family oxidoreductase [bacterium]|nr:Gfo/Idh/MocA family oxidoreductase [bacterium]